MFMHPQIDPIAISLGPLDAQIENGSNEAKEDDYQQPDDLVIAGCGLIADAVNQRPQPKASDA